MAKVFIPYSRVSEFEVQAQAYTLLKEAGFDVRGEVKVRGDRSKGIRGARFDLVIFNPETKEPLLLIETKRNPDGQTRMQGNYYERLTGLRCLYVRGEPELAGLSERVEKAIG